MPAKKPTRRHSARKCADPTCRVCNQKAPPKPSPAVVKAGKAIDKVIRETLITAQQRGGILHDHGAGKTARTADSPELIHLRARVEVLEESERTLMEEQRKADHRLSSERSRHKAAKRRLAEQADTIAEQAAGIRNAHASLEDLHKEKAEEGQRLLRLRQSLEDGSHPLRQEIDRLSGEVIESKAARDAAEARVRELEAAHDGAQAQTRIIDQQRASLQRQVNERDADLAEVRAGRDRERREYIEARSVHDATLFRLNDQVKDLQEQVASEQSRVRERDEYCRDFDRMRASLDAARNGWKEEVGRVREDLGRALDDNKQQILKVQALENHHRQLVEGAQAEAEAKTAAEKALCDARADVAVLNNRVDSLREAQREADRKEHSTRAELAKSQKAAEGFYQACQAEIRDAEKAAAKATDERRTLHGWLDSAINARDAAQDDKVHLEQLLRTADAHTENLRRELREMKGHLETIRQAMHIATNGCNHRDRIISSWVDLCKALHGLFVGREQTMHAQLTESITTYQNFPEIARTLRAVRVMLFPPNGLLPDSVNPQA